MLNLIDAWAGGKFLGRSIYDEIELDELGEAYMRFLD